MPLFQAQMDQWAEAIRHALPGLRAAIGKHLGLPVVILEDIVARADAHKAAVATEAEYTQRAQAAAQRAADAALRMSGLCPQCGANDQWTAWAEWSNGFELWVRVCAGRGGECGYRWAENETLTAEPVNVAELQQELQHLRDFRDQNLQAYGRVLMTSAPYELASTGFYLGRAPTAEERAALEAQHAESRRSWQEREAEKRAAEERAIGLLEERVGSQAIARILNGGGFSIPSRTWPNVVYMVSRNPHQRVQVIRDGAVVTTESCLVTTDNSLPWADIMLQRILAIQTDESVVWTTGILHHRDLPVRLDPGEIPRPLGPVRMIQAAPPRPAYGRLWGYQFADWWQRRRRPWTLAPETYPQKVWGWVVTAIATGFWLHFFIQPSGRTYWATLLILAGTWVVSWRIKRSRRLYRDP